MGKRFWIAIALVLGFSISWAGIGEAREFVLGHTGQPSVTFAQAAEKFAELLSAESGGAMKLKVMGAAALGNNREGIEQLQQGVTDFWIISTGLLAQFTKAVTVYDLPYLFKSEAAGMAFFNSPTAQEIVKPLEGKGLKSLGYFSMGWRHIHSNIAVRKPEDLKGVKIRTEPAPIRMSIFKVMGANPIPMDFGEVFTSLQQGVIDAGENSLENIQSQGFHTVQKYVTLDGHILDPMLLVISKKTWDGLSDAERETVQKAATEACKWDQENIGINSGKILVTFKAEPKPEIIELSAEERAAFREAAQPVYDSYFKDYGTELYDKIMEFQSSYEAEAPKN